MYFFTSLAGRNTDTQQQLSFPWTHGVPEGIVAHVEQQEVEQTNCGVSLPVVWTLNTWIFGAKQSRKRAKKPD